MTYAEKLKDPRWQRKRLEILQRDNWTCKNCGATDTTLHVHHLSYTAHAEPWEAADENLVTVCAECHPRFRASELSSEAVEKRVDLIRLVLSVLRQIPDEEFHDMALTLFLLNNPGKFLCEMIAAEGVQ